MKESIGIIGAGSIGQTVAKYFANAGYEVILSNSKAPESLSSIVKAIGGNTRAELVAEAAQADIVVLALPWSQINVIPSLTNWDNKLVIDAMNAYSPDFQPLDLGTQRSSEIIAGYVKGASLVKMFNTLYFKILAEIPESDQGNRILFFAGDDAAAKQKVSEIITTFGFAGVDIGDLFASKIQEPNQPLSGLNTLKVK